MHKSHQKQGKTNNKSCNTNLYFKIMGYITLDWTIQSSVRKVNIINSWIKSICCRS